MRVLYGVVGEGMGHAIRSKVVIQHLLEQGHEVKIMTSGRALSYLSKVFGGVHRIQGLHLVAKNNRVLPMRTILSNLARGAGGLPTNLNAYFQMKDGFQPEAVISDFESWTHLYGHVHRIPVFSLDNIQMIPRCSHSSKILAGKRSSFELTRSLISGKMQFSDHYIVTSMFDLPLRKSRTTLVSPALREEILDAPRKRGNHLLVYQTFDGYGDLERALKACGVECRIYGMKGVKEGELVDGNLRYRPFSEFGFIEDLASCRGVIGAGGFTLMSEAIYLHKPMLALPLDGQFEQTINSRYLVDFGFGQLARQVSKRDIFSFLDRLEQYQEKVSHYRQNGNEKLLRSVDELLDRVEAGLFRGIRWWGRKKPLSGYPLVSAAEMETLSAAG